MNELTHALTTMSHSAIEMVSALEAESLKLPQIDIKTEHAFHAGMYARTIMIPAGTLLTGALIQIATILVISGDVLVFTEGGPKQISGYRVMLGAPGRKQAFLANIDTHMTMIFPTTATTVQEAEDQFTRESDRLFSRRDGAANSMTEVEI